MILLKRSSYGFLYLDLQDKEAFIVINNVMGALEEYTQQEIQVAHRVYKARSCLGNQSEGDLEYMTCTQSVTGLDTTPQDVTDSNVIYGRHLPGVRGKPLR